MRNANRDFGLVVITGLKIDLENRRFEAEVLTKNPGQRKFHSQGKKVGYMTWRVHDFFTKKMRRFELDENGQFILNHDGSRIFTGNYETGFQKYCRLHGININPETFVKDLANVKFQSENKSQNFWMNPFKVISRDNNDSIFATVSEKPAKKKVTYDPTTGKDTVSYETPTYFDKAGKKRVSKYAKQYWYRFVDIKNDVPVKA